LKYRGGLPEKTPKGVTDAGLKLIGKGLKGLGLLEKVRISFEKLFMRGKFLDFFRGKELTDTGVKYIAESLNSLELLQSIYLSFKE